jgi:translation initiation factor 2B subunit (eIF-2B alpha/beta/delta family)
MLDRELLERIREIADDQTSGSAQLAERAVSLLAAIPSEQLSGAATALIQTQPAMASVYNAAQAALSGRLEEFSARLRRSAEMIALRAAERVHRKVVLTHSFSSTVVHALQLGQPRRVICTESLPGGEGRRTAAACGGEVIPDATMYSALHRIDIIVVGADAVTPEVVVNKVGTALLALAARELGKEIWVLCGQDKYVPSHWDPTLGELFEATPRPWFNGILDDSA